MANLKGLESIVSQLRAERTSLVNQLRHVDAALSVLGKLNNGRLTPNRGGEGFRGRAEEDRRRSEGALGSSETVEESSINSESDFDHGARLEESGRVLCFVGRIAGGTIRNES